MRTLPWIGLSANNSSTPNVFVSTELSFVRLLYCSSLTDEKMHVLTKQNDSEGKDQQKIIRIRIQFTTRPTRASKGRIQSLDSSDEYS